jgi:hypothetical protein
MQRRIPGVEYRSRIPYFLIDFYVSRTAMIEKIISRVILLTLLSFVVYPVKNFCQGSAGNDATIEPRYIIDEPTAGILHHRTAALDMEFFQQGGMLLGLSVGLLDRMMFGVSYGATGLIGTDHPAWNPLPGIALKIRLLDETYALPALAVGFDSQGKETYLADASRYTIKSPGFYLAASKNYQAYGFLSFHGGISYSLEHADGDTDPDLFAGVEKTVGSFISVLAEYNLGWNDSNHDARGKGRGYLNTGIAVSAWNGVTLKLFLKDLFRNQQDVSVGNRVFSVDFVNPI